MRRIHLTIDKVVLNGIDSADGKAVIDGLRGELTRMLADRSGGQWAKSRRTPVLRLPSEPIEPGSTGGKRFGANIARGIGRGMGK